MFETLQKATLDKIFVLMAEYAADPRTNKIDLGVGVYKDPQNNTPIMSAVKKAEQRIFYWYSGYPGGLKEHTPKTTFAGKYPERVVHRAIERMMPKDSPLAREQMKKLKIYAGAAHPHEAQSPEAVDIAGRNRKNKP